jgi:hypothetical protein
MCGCALNASLASLPARSTMHSEVNTKGDFGSCSRCNRRRARSSSPMMGWVLGVPCLTLRTRNVAVLKQVHQLRGPQAVPIRHQDHCGVPVPPTIALGGIHQPLDFRLGQIVGIALFALREQIFDGSLIIPRQTFGSTHFDLSAVATHEFA